MADVGIRELRARLSEYLDQIIDGNPVGLSE